MPERMYDWGCWFARAKFTLRRGRDYHCPQSSMTQQIRNAAWRRGLKVQLQDQGEQILVTVVEGR